MTLLDIGHGALMDRTYRWQRHVYDVTRKHYLLGRDHLIDNLDVTGNATVLELGCGTARNLIGAAQKYPEARLYGIDISDEMLVTACLSVSRSDLQRRILLAQADATNFDPGEIFGVSTFDRIFLSYCLSMIPGWRNVLTRAVQYLAPGGKLCIVDFGRQDELPSAFANALRWWLRNFHVTPRLDLGEEISKLAIRHKLSAQQKHLYRGYASHYVLEKKS